MGTKRLRESSQHQQDQPTGGRTRRARVRNRLLVCVLVGTLAVLAAGAPMLIAASSDLSESQGLVERAETGKRAVSLAHALADERDGQVRRLAAKGADVDPEPPTGLPGEPPPVEQPAEPVDVGPLEKQVDSRVRELQAELPAEVAELVDAIPEQRRQARAANGSADSVLTVHAAYTDAVQALGGVTEDTARDLPPRATEDSDPADPHALPYLGRGVEQAAATRGLLLAALTAGGPQPDLTAAAQQARVREQAADADFEQAAHEDTRERLSTTVTGSEVTTAERYLDRLTADSRLSEAAQRVSADRVETSLTARVDRMRSVHSSLAGEEVERLETLRDNDVTALQLGFVWVGGALLLAIAAGVYSARSMTRPLAVLRLGAARLAGDPANEPEVRFTGRNDEFAEVVRSLNQVREVTAELRERAETAESDAVRQAAGRKKLAADREALRTRTAELEARLAELDGAVHGAFVQLALRNLGLAERQLSQLEALEEREHEPARLSTLFALDHLATRMRRHGENLLLLAGAEHATHQHPEPVSLLDVVRAAISEIERYERVELATTPPHTQVAGFAADDVSHLVAELLDNATAFSPPESEVQVSGWMLENGELMLSVADTGIGMTAERLTTLNERLSEPEKQDPPSATGGDALGVGLYVVAKLAERHGIRVQLRVQKQGGVTAVVVLPRALLPDRPTPGRIGPAAAGAVDGPSLPGTEAEANSHTLPARRGRLSAARGASTTAAGAAPAGDATQSEPAESAADADAPAGDSGGAATSPVASASSPVADEAVAGYPSEDAASEETAAAGSATVTAGEAEAATGIADDTETPHAGATSDAAGPQPATDAETPDTRPEAGPEAGPEADSDSGPDSDVRPAPGSESDIGQAPETDQLPRTALGLAKRTPRVSPMPPPASAVPAPRAGDDRADELRRRISGFRSGSQRGQSDAAALLAAEDKSEAARRNPPGTPDSGSEERPGAGGTTTGGTADIPAARAASDTGADTYDTDTTNAGTGTNTNPGSDTTDTDRTAVTGPTENGDDHTTRDHGNHQSGADEVSQTAEEARK
ncbi:nitrate- and nitrite sensing domain-containing protein [Streptomyces sp. XM4193]|uniref:nitrate- and nitrite sensing domain-containing protein n=1 Tax=Streptomyces sp. XM4193 TaxID=2929782 RepID=UPI001FF7D0EF|nr:nitrate- and nitrite sensing domain-containing protein [Streptomyces sp. XM4193]MCK1797422.1 nitrate- and nitrite sensing domain-containing protein [Streptomyces sp. XM4193]